MSWISKNNLYNATNPSWVVWSNKGAVYGMHQKYHLAPQIIPRVRKHKKIWLVTSE